MGWGEENGEILPERNTNHPDGEHCLLSGLVHLVYKALSLPYLIWSPHSSELGMVGRDPPWEPQRL